jgi:hypothetical protein
MKSNIIEKVLTKKKIDAVLEAIKPSPLLKRRFQSAKMREVGQGRTYRQVGKPMKTSQFRAGQEKRITAARAGDARAQGELKRGAFTATRTMGDAAAGQSRQARLNKVVSGRKKQQMVNRVKTTGKDLAKDAARGAGRMAADAAQETGRRRRERMNTNYTGQPVSQKVMQSGVDSAYDKLRDAMGGKKKPEGVDRSTISSTKKEGTDNSWRNQLMEAMETGKVEREKMMNGEAPPPRTQKPEHSVIDSIIGINRK